MPDTSDFTRHPPDPNRAVTQMEVTPEDADLVGLNDDIDSFISGARLTRIPPDILLAEFRDQPYPNLDFNSSVGLFEVLPSNPASTHHPTSGQWSIEHAMPSAPGADSPTQVLQDFPIPSDGPRAPDTSQSVCLPPPLDGQALYESKLNETTRILTAVPPTSELDGWLGTLHIAAQKGYDGMVQRLLADGKLDCDDKDSDGRTALMHAVTEGHATIVRTLLRHGAKVAETDIDSRSPVHLAVLHKREDILKILLEEKQDMDIDAYDIAGWTALQMAIDRNFEAGAKILLQNGANVLAKARKCPLILQNAKER